MDSIDEFYFRHDVHRSTLVLPRRTPIEDTPTRFIAIELSEIDWLELRAIQPEPAVWMKKQIQQVLDRHRENARVDRASTERLRWSEGS